MYLSKILHLAQMLQSYIEYLDITHNLDVTHNYDLFETILNT